MDSLAAGVSESSAPLMLRHGDADDGPLATKMQDGLKRRIKACSGVRTRDYTGAQKLGESIFEDLKQMLDRTYPPNQKCARCPSPTRRPCPCASHWQPHPWPVLATCRAGAQPRPALRLRRRALHTRAAAKLGAPAGTRSATA